MSRPSDAASLVVDEKGCLLDMNRSARETFGLTLMMLEQRAADVLPQLAEYLGDGSQTAATSGEISLSAGGQTRAFDVSVQDVRFRERLVVGRLIRLHDITERRRADEAVRENERRIRILFDSLDDAIFVHDIPDGAIVDVNERAIEMYDYSRDEILHLTIGELSAGETPYSEEDARERLRRAMEGQRQTFEWLARDKEGKLFWTEVTMRLTSVLGKEQILSSVHDIGKRKKAEVKLLRTMKELEAFNSAMVGREQRMIELKQEINALMPELGRPPRYRIPHDPEPSDNPQPQTNVQPVQFVQSSKEKEKDSDGNNM
ncbi:MAG: PAS domain S-box protein [bacterium]